jgi:polyferredoxin
MPNSVSPINQFFVLLGPTSSQPIQLVLPMIIILAALLGLTVIFGRIYCGYSCPLGAMQELCSKLNFKSSLKKQKQVRLQFNPSRNVITPIRWIYMIVFILTAFFLGLTISELMNLFLVFQISKGIAVQLILFQVVFFIIILISSFFIYRPWCRFFCPFGTLANILNRFYKRNLIRTDSCTDCGLCEQICPTKESYRTSTKAECFYCNRCIDICPHNAIIYSKIPISVKE